MLGMEEEQLEYSSGCESGWTMYLLHSSCGRSSPSEKANVGLSCGSYKDQDGDDMSMMSDASSGPALLHEDGSFLQGKSDFASASSSLAPTRKSESSRRGTRKSEQEKRLPWMDDTASSYAVSFSKTSKEMKWVSAEQIKIFMSFFHLIHRLASIGVWFLMHIAGEQLEFQQQGGNSGGCFGVFIGTLLNSLNGTSFPLST